MFNLKVFNTESLSIHIEIHMNSYGKRKSFFCARNRTCPSQSLRRSRTQPSEVVSKFEKLAILIYHYMPEKM